MATENTGWGINAIEFNEACVEFTRRTRAAEAEYCLDQRKLDRAQENARTLLENAGNSEVAKYVAVAHRLLGDPA